MNNSKPYRWIGMLILSSLVIYLNGQNLVPNGDFENLSQCPDDHSQIDRAIGWSTPSLASPDLYDICAGAGRCNICVPSNVIGSQFPQSATGYVGMFTMRASRIFPYPRYRENIRTELQRTLLAGETYSVIMHVNLADDCMIGAVAPQIHFSKTNYTSNTEDGFLDTIPQVDFDSVIVEKFEWVRLQTCFEAQGGERFITIGNFKNDDDSRKQDLMTGSKSDVYFYIDNIIITLDTPTTDLSLPQDTTICPGDSLLISLPPGQDYLWSDLSTENPRVLKRTGVYAVSVQSECLVSKADTMFLRVNDELNFRIPDSVFICENGEVVMRPSGRVDTWLWHDGSTADSFKITEPGLVWLEGTNNCGTVRDTIIVERVLDPRSNLIRDTSLCEGDTLWLTADPSLNPIWEGTTQSDSFMVTEAGQIILELSNFCGAVTDFIRIELLERPEIQISNVMDFCAGDSILITPEVTADQWSWLDNFPDSLRWIKEEGWFGITATTECETIMDSFFIRELYGPFLALPEDTTLCDGNQLDIILSNVENVRWSDGSTDSVFSINSSGIYWVEATNECGQTRDSINVNYIQAPTVELGNDTILCSGDSLVLTYSGQDDWVWSDGSSTRQFVLSQTGTYFIEVSNICGVRRDTINIQAAEKISMELPDSIVLCEGQSETITPTTNSPTWNWSNGTSNIPLQVSRPGQVWASAQNACGEAADTMLVIVDELPNWIELSANSAICPDDTITLIARTEDNDLIIWKPDNVMGSLLVVTRPGTYEVSASNECGEIVDEVIVENKDCGCQVFVPNTFTPNGDNINDELEVFAGCDLQDLSLEIYSRWGELIFRSEEGQVFWDGTFNGEALPPDVFVYTASYSIGGFAHLKSGSVTLIR